MRQSRQYKLENPEETWDKRIYNDFKLKSKTSIFPPNFEYFDDEEK